MRQPTVGTPPEYTIGADDVPWLLGTHLTEQCGPLARAPEESQVLLIEAHDFARRMPYHHHKLTLVFAAMRHARDRLREAGYDVTYIQTDTFADAFETFFADNPDTTLVTMRSPSHGSERQFRDLVAEVGGDLRVVENELFVSTRQAFDEWINGDREFRHERFYRWMRKQTGVLMDGDDPIGGEWNYDTENREFPPEEWEAPSVPTPESDALTEETAAWVSSAFDTWGSPEGFHWPVTRQQARDYLNHFVTHRLPVFGPYQDAMRSADWAMAHSLLGASVNIGLLHPLEVIEAVTDAYHSDEVDLPSAEGYVRQILGWREFMRHIYRHTMPELATANQLNATHSLPTLYWSDETDMHCLAETVGDVHARGYSHHIQRLMILANFATLWGVEPQELNEWFHATYVDAYHWVTTPNVIEMGQYGHGVFATKPYVSSANYIDRMSNYCEDCRYDSSANVGEEACPFNALYWQFLDRNEEPLRSIHRMGLMYSHVDDKRESGEIEEIRDRVDRLRELAADSDL
ncbi:cryptochrome/photolyase family protein [Halocatena marina]|uniref:cryptochrome/photolyase family protein n=1 Tax=Halocatena marina TaxID=2934937 RepID=UPI00200E66F2|nr:cryptochrome/photolyase family protein [Halocatena marina]